MGFLDKIMFWKKDDDFGLNNLNTDFTKPPANQNYNQGFGQDNQASGFGTQNNFQQSGFGSQDSFGTQQGFSSGYGNQPQSFGQQNFGTPRNDFEVRPVQPPASTGGTSREMDLVLSKLDAIRQTLDSMSQRLEHVERIAMQEEADQKKRQRGW